MKIVTHITLFVVIVYGCSLMVLAQSDNACQSPNVFDYDEDNTLTVDARTLLESPKCYDGRFIRTVGFYSYGIEMSSLFCTECGTNRIAWVNMETFYGAIKRCTSPEMFKKFKSKNGGGTLGVVVLGVLKTKLTFDSQKSLKNIGSKRFSETVGGFGHMNAYDNEFSPICFEQVEVFSNYSVVDDETILKKMKKWEEKMSEKY